jgi:hypothetical protein
MVRSAYVAQAAKPADEAKPRPIRKKTNARRRATSRAGLAACATFERGQREVHSVPSTLTLKQHIIVQKKYEEINWGFSMTAPTPTASQAAIMLRN